MVRIPKQRSFGPGGNGVGDFVAVDMKFWLVSRDATAERVRGLLFCGIEARILAVDDAKPRRRGT